MTIYVVIQKPRSVYGGDPIAVTVVGAYKFASMAELRAIEEGERVRKEGISDLVHEVEPVELVE